MKSQLFNYDLDLLKDYDYICGIDEVGRGCLAGPLVITAIIMKYDKIIEKVNDSKKLTPKTRELLYQQILSNCLTYQIIEVDIDTIDELNIYQATKQAMIKACKEIKNENTLFLSDAMPLGIKNNIAIIKGDSKSYAIACASIVAKVYRDNLMIELSKEYPLYHFEQHKGYGTKKHLEAIDKYGYLENVHRKSFEPIKSLVNKQLKLF